jgi:hypothetical protein
MIPHIFARKVDYLDFQPLAAAPTKERAAASDQVPSGSSTNLSPQSMASSPWMERI